MLREINLGVMTVMKRGNQVVFYVITRSTIKKFIILDCIAGSSIFYTFKFISSSVVVGLLVSYVCTEGMKRLPIKQMR